MMKNSQNKQDVISSLSPSDPSSQIPSQSPLLNQPPSAVQDIYPEQSKKKKRVLPIVLAIVIILIIASIVLVVLAEIGLVQTGIDRLYGKTNLSQYWGSLPAHTKTALIQTLESMKQMTGFDVEYKTMTGSAKITGTVLNNGDYQSSYGTDQYLVEYRKIGDSIYFKSPGSEGWEEKNKQNSDYLFYATNNLVKTSFGFDPYSSLERIIEGTDNFNFRDDVVLGKERADIYIITITPDQNMSDQKLLETLESGGEIDPLILDKKMETELTIKNHYLSQLKIKSTRYNNKPTLEVLITYSPTNKTGIEKPVAAKILDESTPPNRVVKIRDARRRTDLHNISRALMIYANDNQGFVPQTTQGEPSLQPILSFNKTAKEDLINLSVAGNMVEKAIVPKYLNTIPKDPDDTGEYYYSYVSNGYHYRLSAVWEEKKNGDCEEKLNDVCFTTVSQ